MPALRRLLAMLVVLLMSAGVAVGPADGAKGGGRAKVVTKRAELGKHNRVRIRLVCKGRKVCRGRLVIRSLDRRHRIVGSARFRTRSHRARARAHVTRRFARSVRARGKRRVRVTARTHRGRGVLKHTRRVWIGLPAPPAPPVPPAPQGPHRIAANATRLYDTVTGATFRPRGANYVRLRTSRNGATYHATFEPGFYDAARAQRALDGMRAAGYNTVRVLIDPGNADAADAHGIGRGMGTSDVVYGPYMDNVANFAVMAAARGIYLVPSLDVFPQNSRYWGIVASTNGAAGTPNMAGRNLSYLDKGRVAAKAEYMKQFSAALLARIGAYRASEILAYQADNELFFEANHAPYDKMSGTVTPLNGVTYDMSVSAQRQQSADASLVEYSRRVKRGLLAGDPRGLLTIGFFTNRAVGKTGFDGFGTYCSTSCQPGVDYRVPGRAAALSRYGVADFIDIHTYPNSSPWNATYDLNTIERSLFARPYVIGEFGAFKSVYGNDLAKAVAGMREAQAATCKLGAQGWLYWTWDTHESLASQPLFFHMDEGGGAISRQLAPTARIDPCGS